MRHGANARPASLPEYAETVEQIRSLVTAHAAWIQPSDEPLLMVFVAEYVVFRRAAAALAQMSPSALMKRGKAQQTQTKRARVLNELARDLGLSTAGRFKLGLTEARTQAELHKVTPVRSEERAMEVAEILRQARALPPAEPEASPEPPESIGPTEGEVVELRPVTEATE